MAEVTISKADLRVDSVPFKSKGPDGIVRSYTFSATYNNVAELREAMRYATRHKCQTLARKGQFPAGRCVEVDYNGNPMRTFDDVFDLMSPEQQMAFMVRKMAELRVNSAKEAPAEVETQIYTQEQLEDMSREQLLVVARWYEPDSDYSEYKRSELVSGVWEAQQLKEESEENEENLVE